MIKNLKQYLNISFEINGYPEELGSDNGKEFKNSIIENYLRDNNIKFIHGNPYNPHSQGVVERFHQTIKDLLYCYYFDKDNKFNLQDSLNFVLKKYNNHKHSSTLMTPNEVFYSKSKEIYIQVLDNIKKKFKNISKELNNFNENEKVLLNPKFVIKKKYVIDKPGILVFNRVKNLKTFNKINAIIIKKSGYNYYINLIKDLLNIYFRFYYIYYVY